MAKVIVGMTTSLDGFVADASGSVERLYPDLAALQGSAFMNAMIEETGAVLMGKRTFEMGDPDWYAGNYEFQLPLFVLTHDPPQVAPRQSEQLVFTFVTDGVESAVDRRRPPPATRPCTSLVASTSPASACELVWSTSCGAMSCLSYWATGFGSSRGPAPELRLEKISVQDAGARTSFRFRVER